MVILGTWTRITEAASVSHAQLLIQESMCHEVLEDFGYLFNVSAVPRTWPDSGEIRGLVHCLAEYLLYLVARLKGAKCKLKYVM